MNPFIAPAIRTAAGCWTATLIWACVLILLWASFLLGMIVAGVAPQYGGQPRRTWALKIAMLMHHLVIGPAALIAIFQDTALRQVFGCFGCADAAWNMIRDTSEGPSTAAEWLMPVTMGYMIADLVLIPCWSLGKPVEGTQTQANVSFFSSFLTAENVLMVLHHVISLGVWPPTLLYNYCSRYVVILLAYEISSIFLTFMWLLSNGGWKQHIAYKVNGLVFTVSFVVVRMFGAVPQLIALVRVPPFSKTVAERVAPGELMEWQILLTGTLVLPHLLNLFWGVKVVKGFVQTITGGARSSKPVPLLNVAE